MTSRRLKSFGDCANCAAPESQPMPLGAPTANLMADVNAKLGKAPTAFTHGNGLNTAAPQLQLAQANAIAALPAPAAPQPPLVAPQFVMPTQSRVDALFSPTWMQNCIPPTYVYPNTPAYYVPMAWML